MPSATPPITKAETATNDDWLTPRRFAALLALLVLASYPQVLLGLQTFVNRDFGFYAYPVAHHFRESFWQGEVPLWNPLSNCGEPFLAQWNTQVLYPPALFYLVLPLSWSLGVFCLLHLFWGGLGMFYLVRSWTGNHFAAAFAGIVFAFNGLMLNSLMGPSTIASLGWMPWVVWLTERAWREGGKMIILAALAGALQMLAGGAETVILTWAFLGSLGLIALVRAGASRGKIFLRASLVVLLISGLSAAQLLPFFELLDDSRSKEIISAALWPMPASGWLNFFVPLFHCHAYHGVFMQANQFWTSSYYLGVTTMALAVWALWRSRQAVVWLLAALTGFCLILALGEATPVYRWLSAHSSAMGLMRFPVKFVILPVFALPLLAAYGLVKNPADQGRKNLRFGRAWGVICFAVVALIAGIIGWNYRFQPAGENPTTVMVNGLLRAVFFLAIVAGLFFTKKISELKLRRTLQVLLLLLVWFDLFRQAPQPQTVSRAVFQPNLPHGWAATPRLGVARAMIPPSVRQQFVAAFIEDPTENFLSRRFALSLNCNLLDDIPKCDDFFPLELHRYVLLFASDLTAPMLDFVGASQIITVESNAFAWQPRATFLPLLTGGQKPVFAGDATVLQILGGTHFDPRAEVYLPVEAKDFITVTNPATVKITAENFSAQRIEATVAAAAPALLVAAQTYYHPWRAYVDGEPVPLWRANFNFQAVEVPAGTHRVKLVYEDRRFYLGATVSLTTLAGCLIFLCLRRRVPPIP